ncbi:unnamed protein product [Parajaminaea phylloscopi]
MWLRQVAPSTRRFQSCQASTAASSTSSASQLPPVHVALIPHLVPYHLGLALQEALYSLRGETECVLLLEHKPVYTEGRRGPEDGQEAVVRQRLQAIGADYHLTKRGGLITYHGPGQLVGYPILHLGRMGLSSRCYVDRIQEALISTLGSYTLPTVPPPEDHTGVWADSQSKIVSIGVQVRHRITTHGFALNVTREVDPWFKRIVACGIQGKRMTSMQEQLALRIQDEEDARPDLEAAPANTQRVKTSKLESTTDGAALVGPEVELVQVRDPRLISTVTNALSSKLDRRLIEAEQGLLQYEADENNVLTRVWVRGQEVSP